MRTSALNNMTFVCVHRRGMLIVYYEKQRSTILYGYSEQLCFVSRYVHA